MRTLIASLVLLAVVACADDPASPATSIVGTYSLQTVNGTPLPFVVQAAGPRIEVIPESFVVSSHGTFTAATVFRTTNGTVVTTATDTETGTYSVSGTTATFRDPDGSVAATGTIGSGTLTIAQDGITLFLVKQ